MGGMSVIRVEGLTKYFGLQRDACRLAEDAVDQIARDVADHDDTEDCAQSEGQPDDRRHDGTYDLAVEGGRRQPLDLPDRGSR